MRPSRYVVCWQAAAEDRHQILHAITTGLTRHIFSDWASTPHACLEQDPSLDAPDVIYLGHYTMLRQLATLRDLFVRGMGNTGIVLPCGYLRAEARAVVALSSSSLPSTSPGNNNSLPSLSLAVLPSLYPHPRRIHRSATILSPFPSATAILHSELSPPPLPLFARPYWNITRLLRVLPSIKPIHIRLAHTWSSDALTPTPTRCKNCKCTPGTRHRMPSPRCLSVLPRNAAAASGAEVPVLPRCVHVFSSESRMRMG